MNRDLETATTLALVAIILDVIGFVFALVTIFLVILPLIFMILNYVFVYSRLKENHPDLAQTPALALGIIELIFGGIIPGILLIICYVKINDGITAEARKMMAN
jgi:uncharacterized BrkB/YihY/UPF0761 family membrane protein